MKRSKLPGDLQLDVFQAPWNQVIAGEPIQVYPKPTQILENEQQRWLWLFESRYPWGKSHRSICGQLAGARLVTVGALPF